MGRARTCGPMSRVSVVFPHSMEEAASALILRLHPFLSPSELCSLAGARLLVPPSCVVMPICHVFFYRICIKKYLTTHLLGSN